MNVQEKQLNQNVSDFVAINTQKENKSCQELVNKLDYILKNPFLGKKWISSVNTWNPISYTIPSKYNTECSELQNFIDRINKNENIFVSTGMDLRVNEVSVYKHGNTMYINLH